MGNVLSAPFPAPKDANPVEPKPVKKTKKTAAQIIAEAVAEDQK
jgi:hypothetical protein